MHVKTAIFAATVAIMPAAALAEGTPCYQRAKLVEALSTKYKEAPAAGGLQSDTQMIEIWTSSETGTFTVLVSRADGISCIVATGNGWQALAAFKAEGMQG